MDMAVIRGGETARIDLSPETAEAEVTRNVAMILVTPKHDVPLGRGIGIAQEFIDRRPDVARTVMIGEIVEAVSLYEPRAEVVSVSFEAGADAGKYTPVIEVNINVG
jgi:phage baseplate assembly protein W